METVCGNTVFQTINFQTVSFLARGYPTLHLAMIFDDGLVYDFSVKNRSLHSMNLLMKLPKSKQYFGYSDHNGVIYFIHSGTKKPITKYHKSFNKNGHVIVDKSKRSKAFIKEIESKGFSLDGFQYSYGVLMGNRFWTFVGYEITKYANFKFVGIDKIHTNQTTIWSTKKLKWIKGPALITTPVTKDLFLYKSMVYTYSYAEVINSTSIILIGGDTVVCYDITTNRWTDYPDFPLNSDRSLIRMVTPTVSVEKNGKRYNVFPKK